MRILPWILPVLLAAPAAAQPLKTVTNKKQGFKVKLPRFVKETPTQPDEIQIIAKYKGSKEVKARSGYYYSDPKTGKRKKTRPEELEIWIFRIENPKSAKSKMAPVTGSGGTRQPKAKSKTEKNESIGDALKRRKNSGRTVKEFFDRRFSGISTQLQEKRQSPPWRDKDKNEFQILKLPTRPGQASQLQCFVIEHDVPHFGHELFGMVWKSSRMGEFQKYIAPCVKSLRREATRGTVYAKADPYKDSQLRSIPKRREIRSRLVKGWYAKDTENFILITDMPNSSSNHQLLRDMMIDLETMRKEYEKRFPPIAPFDVVCTVRVCNSYDGYIRFSEKPGTGGYWNPIDEELVLFNPVGKVRKQAWLKLVKPKETLYHEAMHQYFHYANGELPPASWFNEGYGEYFGGAKTDRYQKKIISINKNQLRWQLIKKDKKDKKWPLIKRMLPMTQQVFYSRTSKDYPVMNNYAFAWAFCYFLEKERSNRNGNKEWAAIPDKYLKNLRKAADEIVGKLGAKAKGSMMRFAIPIQRRAYQLTFSGTDFDKLQADWVAAMKSW